MNYDSGFIIGLAHGFYKNPNTTATLKNILHPKQSSGGSLEGV